MLTTLVTVTCFWRDKQRALLILRHPTLCDRAMGVDSDEFALTLGARIARYPRPPNHSSSVEVRLASLGCEASFGDLKQELPCAAAILQMDYQGANHKFLVCCAA